MNTSSVAHAMHKIDKNDYAVTLQDVGKTYRLYPHPSARLKQSLNGNRKQYFTEHIALKPLSLSIKKGQTVGVIGVNGSGKSTLLQLITRTLTPTSGSLVVDGRVSALLELGAGFNPEFSGRENIFLNASIIGMSNEEIHARYDDIVAFSGLEARMLEQAVNTYSSGMYVRLAFAVAIAVEPDILIVDEALAVGDEGFQRKCFARIRELQDKGATILFVSHSARTIIDLCNHAILLDAGELLMQGKPAKVVGCYHKMLFAPEDKRKNIREEIKQADGLPSTQKCQVNNRVETLQHPETRIEYPPNGGRVSEIRVEDQYGTIAQQWVMGETYYLKYRVTCDRDLANLRCSAALKTMTGIELAGFLYRGTDNMFETVKAGTVIDICFTIPCNLTKGDYFINIGIVEDNFGSYSFVHRIVDALHIKVQEPAILRDDSIHVLGFVDIGVTCAIDEA